MSEIVFPSTKAGNEVDRAVTAALSTIPGQITQIDTRVTALEEDVDDLSGLPAQVATIGSKIGDLTQLDTDDKTSVVNALNEVEGEADENRENIARLSSDVRNLEAGGGMQLVSENGLFFTDESYNVGAKFDSNGVDAAKMASHLLDLIKSDVRQEVYNLKRPSVTDDLANITTLGVISDIHGDSVNLEAFIGLCSSFGIPNMIHLGDSTYEYNNGKETSYSFWTGVEGNDEVMNIVGNHDSRRSSSWTGVPQTEVYDCIINPFVDTVSVVQPTDAETNGLCYYYKDLNTHVRLICLDCMFWNQAEYDWLSSVLDDARTNSMHVIIACHYPANAIDLCDSSFNYRKKGAAITDVTIDGAGCLDVKTPRMASDLVQDFIDDGGIFIAWICGHQHRNWLGHLTAHPTQLQFCVPSSRWDYSKPSYYNELGTANQYCFTFLGFDTINRYLKVLRIGKRVDLYMQKQEQFCYDYGNNELIYTT